MFSNEEWQEKLEAQKNSGMTRRAWCDANGIPVHQFTYQFYKPNKRRVEKRFVELKATDRGLKLRWNDVVIELDPDFDEVTLKRFLKVL